MHLLHVGLLNCVKVVLVILSTGGFLICFVILLFIWILHIFFCMIMKSDKYLLESNNQITIHGVQEFFGT